jgi:hypothetical protein
LIVLLLAPVQVAADTGDDVAKQNSTDVAAPPALMVADRVKPVVEMLVGLATTMVGSATAVVNDCTALVTLAVTAFVATST